MKNERGVNSLTNLVKSIQVAPLVLDDAITVFLQTVSSSGAIFSIHLTPKRKPQRGQTVCNIKEMIAYK
jgi:hypothetical protein